MSNISKNKLFILGILSICIMSISGIYAFTSSNTTKVENELNTGGINIQLKEYSINNNGQEVLYNDSNQIIMPGQDVSLIPKISNLGEACYVRAKLTFTNIEDNEILADENINGMASDWKKQGDYWYYNKQIGSGETIEIFKSITIPTNLKNTNQGKSMQVIIVAEAIQARNFELNINSKTPWGNININQNPNSSYNSDKVQSSTKVKVEYENNANQYMDVPDDFLNELLLIMPGDTIVDELTLMPSDEGTKYFFKIKTNMNISEKEIELLKNIKLIISSDKKVVYNGNLYQLEDVLLDEYNSKQAEKLKFTISVPNELDNYYSALKTSITWDFSIINNEKQDVNVPVVNESPQTGDVKIIVAISLFFISTICLIIVLYLGRKYNTEKN